MVKVRGPDDASFAPKQWKAAFAQRRFCIEEGQMAQRREPWAWVRSFQPGALARQTPDACTGVVPMNACHLLAVEKEGDQLMSGTIAFHTRDSGPDPEFQPHAHFCPESRQGSQVMGHRSRILPPGCRTQGTTGFSYCPGTLWPHADPAAREAWGSPSSRSSHFCWWRPQGQQVEKQPEPSGSDRSPRRCPNLPATTGTAALFRDSLAGPSGPRQMGHLNDFFDMSQQWGLPVGRASNCFSAWCPGSPAHLFPCTGGPVPRNSTQYSTEAHIGLYP